jgi:hypothetical protein
MTPAALALAGLVVASPLLLLLRKGDARLRVREDARELRRTLRRAVTLREGWPTLAAYAGVAVLCWAVFAQAMYTQGGGVWTGLDNNIGDLPFHVGIISGFVHGDNFPPEHPEFAGTRLTYPFLADFLTAMFVRAGATREGAMFWQNFLLGLSLVALLHRWARVLTGDAWAAALTPALVLLNGGLGFWHFLSKAAGGRGLIDTLGQLDRYYTIYGDTYKWGNFVTILLVPQRGLLLGVPLALIVWTLWWKATEGAGEREAGAGGRGAGAGGRGPGAGEERESSETRERKQRKGEGKKKGKDKQRPGESSEARLSGRSARASAAAPAPGPRPPAPLYRRSSPATRLLAAGVLAGMLPLVHAHSFVVVMGMGGCVALLMTWWGGREDESAAGEGRVRALKLWAVFFGTALALALPQMLWATRGSGMQAESFFGWQFGWDSGAQPAVSFWLRNTGVFIPLLVAALAWRGRTPVVERRLLLFYLPFTLCFIIPNLLRLSPWIWDNIKILFYWWMASAPLVALLLARLWRRDAAWRAWAAAALVVLLLSGALDVWRAASGAMRQPIFTREDEALAELIRRETPPRSLILHAPTYNHPVYLTGRRTLMGYAGHLSSHGLDYTGRERELARIYPGGAEAEELLRKYGVDYVVIGPHERQGGEMARIRAFANEAFFQRYTRVGQAGGYSLYKTSP